MHAPVDAVLFDFHQTLIDPGHGADWLRNAWTLAGRPGTPEEAWGAERTASFVDFLDHVWTHAAVIDPDSQRDRSPEDHRVVWDRLCVHESIDADLGKALYATILDHWTFYDDAIPLLCELHRRGVRTGILSNIGFDIRPLLTRDGVEDYVDTVTLSYEVHAVKPHAAIFEHALADLGVPASRALMVGDDWRADAGGAAAGIRTLLLPPTDGRTHGLDIILGLVASGGTQA